ncbi:MAG: FMN-binding protein, partial [Verrucomicrobiae bacterium]|nr:FMN-binding protein [Verrucomicrobiae bacterium]
ILKHNQDHARMAIQDLQLYETFDLLKVVDGSFEAGVPAYNGELVVRVTVESHRISDVTVVKHSEKQFYSSLTDMPAKIVEAQDFRGVDATTGATVTAEAIKSATARALRRGRKGE